MALALPGAIAASDLADTALVDLGALVECDAQETGCPEDDLEPREQNGIVATNDRQPGDPRGGLRATPSSRPLNLVENVDTVYLYAIEFRPDDLASRAVRVGLTIFFQNLDLSHLAARSSGRL
jgi:hypothetical protein